MRHGRHSLLPLPSTLTGQRDTDSRRHAFSADAWARLDQVQELGDDGEAHTGCVNALSWSDDGNILLSGSDDKRICIWTPDTRPTSALPDVPLHASPHPLKLRDTIVTGHRANIFSARFLPHTNTIVTCAGDWEVRVFDLQRLTQASAHTISVRARGALWGVEGPGVRVLRCHTDRTKRIATEASPHIFLTVSEDGTVRQHDLRRPHRCTPECPDPIFRAPKDVDLYSLSVSALAPHTFAVAGQTDVAYICDRRKPELQTPGWGAHTKRATQVHCVRRLGLSEEEWTTVAPVNRRHSERHITCVKISPDHPDEVVCAFAMHSTSIFSLNDSPVDRGMALGPTSIVPPNGPTRTRLNPTAAQALNPNPNPEPTSPSSRAQGSSHTPPHQHEAEAESGSSPRWAPKRRLSVRSSHSASSRPGSRARVNASETAVASSSGSSPIASSSPTGLVAVEDDGEEMAVEEDEDEDSEDDRRELRMEEDDDSDSGEEIDIEQFLRRAAADEEEGFGTGSLGLRAEDFEVDDDDDDDDFGDDDDDDDDDEDEDQIWSVPRGARSQEGRFKSVDLIQPRRSFKGARNSETVKDCNFLGVGSDKVASGSDDGNFFVWDKETGRLEGIWEGDRDIVNVMEQHPTLPLIAVSGIDNTVKMFAPTPSRTADNPSATSGGFTMCRTAEADQIIARNANPRRHSFAPMGEPNALQFLSQILAARRTANPAMTDRANLLDFFRAVAADPEEDPPAGAGECQTQ